MDKLIEILKSIWAAIVGFFRKEDSPEASTPVAVDPAPATPAPVTPTPTAPAPADPFGVGFATRAAFDAWVANFGNITYLDGTRVVEGFGPAAYFVTKPDGSIVKQ